MPKVAKDLYQFSTYIPPINLSFHRYLLLSEEPLLIHTGNVQQVARLLQQLEKQLQGRGLRYIFVSHFESDECGGLLQILDEHPQAEVICSEVTARQLSGFGLTENVLVKKPEEKLAVGGFELLFISYPSEMHLWEGLLAFEVRRKLFFSSDLMIRTGDAEGSIIASDWQREIDGIRPEQIPDPDRRTEMQKRLARLSPILVAPGHGPCLKVAPVFIPEKKS